MLVIFFVLFVSASAKLIPLKAFSHNRLVSDWEYGTSFYVSKDYFAQEVSAAFDLESPYQLLYDANFVDVNNWPQSSYRDYYHPEKSSSFATQNKAFKLQFNGDTQQKKSTVSGVWSTDTFFHLFDESSSAYPNSNFGLIQDGDSFQNPKTIFAYTGRLGMSLNGTGQSNWLIDSIKKDSDGLITFLIFDNMFYLGLGNDGSKIDNCDSKKLISAQVVDTSKDLGKQQWQFQSKSVQFGKYMFSVPQYVRFTLSTAFTYGPEEYVAKLYDLLDAYEEKDQWFVDCDKQKSGPIIEFKTDSGDKVQIPPSVYILKDSSSNECYLAIRQFSDTSNDDHWAIGALFETNYCLTLDFTNEQIIIQPAQDASMSKASNFIKKLKQATK